MGMENQPENDNTHAQHL